jgi:hypothetical protein
MGTERGGEVGVILKAGLHPGGKSGSICTEKVALKRVPRRQYTLLEQSRHLAPALLFREQ